MWLIVAISILCALLYYRRINKMSILSRNGIPGPKPNLIFGNLFSMRKLSPIERQKAWFKKYGKICGCYVGQNPIVLVADPDLAKEIQIKDFNNFTDRPHAATRFLYPARRVDGVLLRASGQHWKQLRSIITPAFSAAKLKAMTSLVDDTINGFLNVIDCKAKSGEEFNIYDIYQKLASDVIIRTAFGIKTEPDDKDYIEFMLATTKVTDTKVNKYLYLMINCFPELDRIIYPIRRMIDEIRHLLGVNALGVILDMCGKVIKLRKGNPNLRRHDLLQAMIDLQVSEDDISDDKLTAQLDENHNVIAKGLANSRTQEKGFRLTDDEIKANCALIYGAGFETTSTALSFATHFMVNYPEIQEKVRQEVKQLYESEGKLDFNTVTKLQYMESVLNETMRIYPPVITLVSRETLADYHYNGMTIPKGAIVAMATHFLQNDPDYWPEPEKFDPDRFSPERKLEINPSSYQPFGSGPRNCVGMRFAYFEMKLALAKLLLEYRLVRSDRTEIGELTLKCKLVSMSPRNGVFIKVVKL